jgi:hypothetical protein
VVFLQLGKAAGDLMTASFMQALKTEAHKIKVAAEETAEQELHTARTARKAEQKKPLKKSHTKHAFVPKRSAEQATTNIKSWCSNYTTTALHMPQICMCVMF